MSAPNERQLSALEAIQANAQGGGLDGFDARECEDLGWALKVGGRYRLTDKGKRLLDELAAWHSQS